MRLEAIYESVKSQATVAVIAPSAKRGILRQVVRLTPRRLDALLAERYLELTLERTIVALRITTDSDFWANQFNPAAGIGGGTSLNRVAVDLARLNRADDQVQLSLNELKAWRSNEPPRSAAEELFAYGSWLALLRQRAVEPYDRQPWTEVDGVEMHLIAPADYFARHGGIAAASSVLRSAETELAALRSRHAELRTLSVAPAPIVLGAAIGAGEFVACFDREAMNESSSTGAGAASPVEVLRADSVPVLRAWLRQAWVEAGSN